MSNYWISDDDDDDDEIEDEIGLVEFGWFDAKQVYFFSKYTQKYINT